MDYDITDVDFRLVAGAGTYGERVARMAVLYPITRPCQNQQQVVGCTRQLVHHYRERLYALYKCGWLPQGSKHSLNALRNCLPAFVYATPCTQCCRLRYLCPFCYARQVISTWEQIDAAMTYSRTATGEYRSQYRVVVRVLPFTRKRRPKSGVDEARYLRYLLRGGIKQRALLVKRVDPVGAFAQLTVAPSRKGWKFRSRQLFLLPPGRVFPETITGKISSYDRPTREVMSRVVARLCRYPCQLLTGDPVRVAQLLEVRRTHRMRLAAFYRCLRVPAKE